MRKFCNDYDMVFVDIDNTLIYGWFTELMHHTWNIFRSYLLSQILMYLQDKLRLYKVNEKLRYSLLSNTGFHRFDKVVFLTVRAESKATIRTVNRIMTGEDDFILYDVVALGSDNGHLDKAQYIYKNYGNKKCLLIDDNQLNRDTAEKYGIDTFNPVLLREKVVG